MASVQASRAEQENAPHLDGAKNGALAASKLGVGVPTRRTALGNVSNNVNRVQPTRAAKAKSQFTIYSDDAENVAPATKDASFQPSVVQATSKAAATKPETSKPKGLAPRPKESVPVTVPSVFQMAPTTREAEPEVDSPMNIDSSLMQLEDSLPNVGPDDAASYPGSDSVLDCPEYASDIYGYLRSFELTTRPKPHYMAKQPDITSNMRSILVDWLVEVSEEYKLHDETLYYAVNYVDRFLSVMSVLRGKLQLVGTAAMFIASKFEEIYPPELNEFVYITDETYTKRQVLRMEHLILKVLDFKMNAPTPVAFLRRFNAWVNSDESTFALSRFLAELTLVDEAFLQYSTSTLSAAALCLARHTLGHAAWPESLATKSGISFADFENCLKDLHRAYLSSSTHPQQAVREKYSTAKHQQVSTLSPPLSLPIC